MRAIRFAAYGGPEVLTLEEIALPAPKPGQVRVRHTVIGVNFIDTYYRRSGLYPVPLPSGLGLEAAGNIDAHGAMSNGFRSQRSRRLLRPVRFGAYAEANNVPADRMVKLPAAMNDEVAAAATAQRDDGTISAANEPIPCVAVKRSCFMPQPAELA